MPNSFHHRLVNGPFGDPALYVRCVWEKRALLFDIGDIAALRPAEILRLTDIFVSHTHVDHFIGFDRMLRVMLNRDKKVRIFGPPGIMANVAGKLAGYTWNLVDDYRLSLQVHEVGPDSVRRALFTCRDRFRHRSRPVTVPFDGRLLAGERFRVEAAHLEHSVPCLAFALTERERIGIDPRRLADLGWKSGPWLRRLKVALRRNEIDRRLQVPLIAGPGTKKLLTLTVGEISARIVIRGRGTKIAYATDLLGTDANLEKVSRLARGADIFYCEAAFLDRDADHARRKHHLTAKQAGETAREAGVRRLEVFHFSPKYTDTEDLLCREAAIAFGAGPRIAGAGEPG